MGDEHEFVQEKRMRFIYQILSTLRASGTRDYHNLNSAYLAGNSIIVAALSFLTKLSDIDSKPLIFITSSMGLFLSFQMWLAQCRFRAINTSYAERLKTLKTNKSGCHPFSTMHILLKKTYHYPQNLRKRIIILVV